MKLLVVTQKVDRNDSTLGTYHEWINEFSKKYESVTVICLYKGEFNLPSNIKVLSLGKEEKQSRLQYLTRFYSYVWKERNNYDAVFVHMNEEYVLLAGWLWRLMGKSISMFRNHIQGTWKTPIAVWLSHVVFCTSPHSYTAKFSKTKIVPAGIDIKKFRVDMKESRVSNSVLSIGRIGPVKNIDTFIEALNLLDTERIAFKANIVGDPGPKDHDYYISLMNLSKDLVQNGKLKFHPAVPNTRTPEFYWGHEIYVNMTNSGSLDKTIFSAMASKCIPVVSNISFKGVIPDTLIFEERNPKDMAQKLKYALSMDKKEKEDLLSKLKEFTESHSLEKTIEVIKETLNKAKV